MVFGAYDISEHNSVRVRLTVRRQIRQHRPCSSSLDEPSAGSARSWWKCPCDTNHQLQVIWLAETEETQLPTLHGRPRSGVMGVLTDPVRLRRWVRAGVHGALPAAGNQPVNDTKPRKTSASNIAKNINRMQTKKQKILRHPSVAWVCQLCLAHVGQKLRQSRESSTSAPRVR